MDIRSPLHWFATVACAILIAGCAGMRPEPLVHLEVHDVPSQNGKVLDASFDELERDAASSLVAVDVRSGGSVSRSFFELRGMCAVAHVHGAAYVSAARVSVRPLRYRVTFPRREATRNANPATLPDTTVEGSEHVMSVSFCTLLGD